LDYKGHAIGESRLDFLVFDSIIVELKAVETISPIHRAIVISYLKLTGHRLALVINFHVKTLKDGIRRIAL
jgi:GxxExxY protein